MFKTYLLGLPLFNLLLWAAVWVDFWSVDIYYQCNPQVERAPASFMFLLLMLLLYGGYAVVGLIYGRYLFTKWEEIGKNIAGYFFLTIAIVFVITVIQKPGSIEWGVWASLEQSVGFLIGAAIAYNRRKKKKEKTG